jgi:mRNA-degrading endonuclease YafQ of YafQ-DinJ toxin-antitoxin module
MIIEFANTFWKQLRRLSPEDRVRVDQTIQIFRTNPFEPSLKNHKLQGVQKGIHSISAAYDMRLLYVEKNGHAFVLFVKVGTHEDVYE